MTTHTVTVEHRDAVTRDLGFGKPIVLAAEGWYATCDVCGWHANNPHPTEDEAGEAAVYHEHTAQIEDGRDLALEAFRTAGSDKARDTAVAAYNKYGAVS